MYGTILALTVFKRFLSPNNSQANGARDEPIANYNTRQSMMRVQVFKEMIVSVLKVIKEENERKPATTSFYYCDVNSDEKAKSSVMHLRNGRG